MLATTPKAKLRHRILWEQRGKLKKQLNYVKVLGISQKKDCSFAARLSDHQVLTTPRPLVKPERLPSASKNSFSVVLDLETTSLSRSAEIMQIAAPRLGDSEATFS